MASLLLPGSAVGASAGLAQNDRARQPQVAQTLRSGFKGRRSGKLAASAPATCTDRRPRMVSVTNSTSELVKAETSTVPWIESAIGHVESAVMRLKADMEHAVARALSVFDGLGTRPAVAVAAPEAEATLEREAPPEPPSSVPPLTKEEALMLYEDMVLGRVFEDMCAQMYYRGKMFGFVHLYNGQEAVSSGVIKYLRKDDWVTSTYRDHVHAVSKGVPSREVMAELFGKSTGCCRGQGGSMHMFSKEWGLLGGFAFIGEGIPVALGAAFKAKYAKEVLGEPNSDQVSVAFFGDGTCNIGQFYECLNMAALWKLPVIFVVENNLWAIGMSHYRSTSDPAIWKKGPAFGMPGVHVDGMDVLKVREVAIEAIARARRGDGPTLIEAETYRFRGHSLADPDELRSPEEKAKYAARDPIVALKKHLLETNMATEAELKAIEKKVDEVVEDAVEFADESPLPVRKQLLENVFVDPKGFGIGPDGKYRCEDPSFTEGTAAV